MKKLQILTMFVLASGILMSARTEEEMELKQSIVLKMPDGGGGNGAAVAYNPKANYYYSVMAGNAEFPMVMFNTSGEMVKDGYKAGFDARSMWYDKKKDRLVGNSFSNGGYVALQLDNDGKPTGNPEILLGGMHQPHERSIGAYNEKADEIIFRIDESIFFYNAKTGKNKRNINLLHIPANSKLTDESVIYTGIKHKELGIYDYAAHKIYLFDASTGVLAQSLKLPESAPSPDVLNFSYSNGTYWLFDKGNRQWIGYK